MPSIPPFDPEPGIESGSFNVNGMSSEPGWIVGKLLRTRNFDGRISLMNV